MLADFKQLRKQSVFTSAAFEKRSLEGVGLVVDLFNQLQPVLVGLLSELLLVDELRYTKSPLNSGQLVVIIKSEEFLEKFKVLGDFFHLILVDALD